MDRRRFLRSACQACGALALLPAAAALESCSSAKGLALAARDGVLDIPLSALDAGGRTVVKAKGVDDKLLVVQRGDGSFIALALNCPHKNGPLKEKDGQLVCAWHGSAFSLEGELLKGPSRQGLKRYPAERMGELLRIRLG